MIDPETQQAIDGLIAQITVLRRSLADAVADGQAVARMAQANTDRLNRWGYNGLNVLDTSSAFAGLGGAFGTSTHFKRSDGT